MSFSSGGSPASAIFASTTMTATMPQSFATIAPHDTFALDMPSPLGDGSGSNANANDSGLLPSPTLGIKGGRLTSVFGREMPNGGGRMPGPADTAQAPPPPAPTIARDDKLNGSLADPSDDGINPLKRRNTDVGGVDYPRRRATIAVGLVPRRLWAPSPSPGRVDPGTNH